MKKTYIVLLIFFFLVFSFSTFGQAMKPATAEQIKDITNQIIKSSKNTNTLEYKFVQKKNISVLSETVTSSGLMYFKRENNLRWQYNKPYSYIFILSGNKVFIKNDKRTDKFDVNSGKMFKQISEIMIGGVNGALMNNSKFSAQYFVGSSSIEAQLTPKDRQLQQMFKQINIVFTKSDWQVKSIEMLEQGGDNTIINFTERNINNAVSDNLFQLN